MHVPAPVFYAGLMPGGENLFLRYKRQAVHNKMETGEQWEVDQNENQRAHPDCCSLA